MKALVVRLVVAISLAVAANAHAQFAVIDPANLAQNVLSATRALTQIQNQVRQLENETQMLANEARNLRSLDFNALNRLRVAIATTQRLLDEADGLAFEVARLQAQFAEQYPRQYTAEVTRARMFADARLHWQRSRDATETTLSIQAQASENISSDEEVLADLVGRSQAAVGALQASQATNQLLALQARQAIQAQQLLIAQDRAEALEQARVISAESRAREVRRRFQGDGARYTPHPVEF